MNTSKINTKLFIKYIIVIIKTLYFSLKPLCCVVKVGYKFETKKIWIVNIGSNCMVCQMI